MIIEIFILFTVLAFILSVLGHYLNQELLIIFGFLMLGVMSAPLLNSNLEFRTGENQTILYTYENISDNFLISDTSNSMAYTYETYESTVWFGIFFLFISLSGMFEFYRGYRKEKGDGE